MVGSTGRTWMLCKLVPPPQLPSTTTSASIPISARFLLTTDLPSAKSQIIKHKCELQKNVAVTGEFAVKVIVQVSPVGAHPDHNTFVALPLGVAVKVSGVPLAKPALQIPG